MEIQNKIKIGIKGEITAKAYDNSRLNRLQKLWNKAVILFNLNRVKWYIKGPLKWSDHKTNIICNAGLLAVCKRLHGDATYTCEINKMALGTGTPVTPAVGDTTLDTETYRNTTASGTSAANIAYLTAYYTETEVTGTFYEFGNFIDGAVGADTGQLWSYITANGWSKDNTTVLVVDCKYTFASI